MLNPRRITIRDIDDLMTWLTLAIILLISRTIDASENQEAKALVWPTDASHLITSSFAEYRDGHFHSGIDIKTWGKTGYKVFAVADGWVSRIKVSPYGFGRALYITLNDGRTVVYGHLQDFSDPISDHVWNVQKANGRYSVELFLSRHEFPVKAGDLVAYTGESGVGPPHLHFEIRNNDEEPLNPLTQGIRIDDSIRPVIAEIAVTPLDDRSRVNGSPVPYFVTPTAGQSKTGSIVIGSPIRVQGRIGISIRADDWAVADGNAFNIYRIILKIADSTGFETSYDQFSYGQTRKILLERDWRFDVQGEGKFVRLYRHPKNTLSFHPSNLKGIINCNDFESLIPFRIVAEDCAGNTAEVKGELLPVAKSVDSENEDYLNEIEFLDSQEGAISITPVFFDNYLSMALPAKTTPRGRLVGWLSGGTAAILAWQRNERGIWCGTAPLDFDYSGQVRLPIYDDGAPDAGALCCATWQQWGVRPNRQRTITFPDSQVTMTFNNNSLWQPICVRCDSAKYPVGGFPYLTRAWKIEPRDVPLAGNVEISWKIPPNQTTLNQIAIYRWSRRAYWKILMPVTYSDDGAINAPTDELGIFALIRDDQPPEVTPVFPKNGAVVTTAKPRLVVHIGDVLSGLDEDGMQMKLDGNVVISEYDPDAQTVSYRPHDTLASGEHQLTAEVRDRAGNVTTKQIVFRISGGSR